MKHQIVPYGANSTGWATGYNLTNGGAVEQTVTVTIRNSAGEVKKTLTVKIPAFAQHILDVAEYVTENYGRHSLFIEGNDDLFVTGFVTGAGGFGLTEGKTLSGELKN